MAPTLDADRLALLSLATRIRTNAPQQPGSPRPPGPSDAPSSLVRPKEETPVDQNDSDEETLSQVFKPRRPASNVTFVTAVRSKPAITEAPTTKSTSTPAPPLPASVLLDSVHTGPSLKDSREQLEPVGDSQEARMMSKTFSRGNTSRPPSRVAPHQTLVSRGPLAAHSSMGNAAQGYGLDRIGKALAEEALVRKPTFPDNEVPPHKRAVTKTAQSLGNENETPSGLSPKQFASSKVKSGSSSSNATRVDLPVVTSPASSLSKTPASTTDLHLVPTMPTGAKIVTAEISNGKNDAGAVEQSSVANSTTNGEIASEPSTSAPHSKNPITTYGDEAALMFAHNEADSLEDTVRHLVLEVKRLQQACTAQTVLLNRLEEERERRLFLGTGMQQEPYTVGLLCQNGYSGKIQTYLSMSGADLIRRIRCKAGVTQFESENIVIKAGTKPLAHIAMVGEQGITSGTKLTATW